VLFFWLFGLNNRYVHQRAGHGNVSAVEMISTALYGAVSLEWGWILNLAVWLAIFVTGAAWRLRRDTARV
jgi:hypothetical protein